MNEIFNLVHLAIHDYFGTLCLVGIALMTLLMALVILATLGEDRRDNLLLMEVWAIGVSFSMIPYVNIITTVILIIANILAFGLCLHRLCVYLKGSFDHEPSQPEV